MRFQDGCQSDHQNRELWIDYEPQGQPSWEAHGQAKPRRVKWNVPRAVNDPYVQELRARHQLLTKEEVVAYLEEQVKKQNNEKYNIVWFQVLKYEYLTDRKATFGIRHMAKMYGPKGLYRIPARKRKNKDGTVTEIPERLRPLWQQWEEAHNKATERLHKLIEQWLLAIGKDESFFKQ